MRLGEECPYITPCGWCSRLCKPCEEKEKQKVRKQHGEINDK
nr:MAG TPA: mbt domain-containing protein 1 [Caudoviricetes sp.]DAM48156.1 MAG TPA: MBT domain-containing protein [Caudoviricetes sp.]DAQ42564.1 MAG TPA: MBT domain-containing protein [Caudoviricetes sp.]DAZ35658.1 MAG TPA: MBT domain-containing protein 1 [Caudoviricetes sp.]